MSKNPKELVGPPDPNQDVRNYAERILGIQNGGVEDTVAELTSEKLESTVATLRGYNDKYGLCSENALANQWYLEHLDVDKETRKKMRDVFKNDRLSQNQKIESQYDILKEKYTGENATDEDGDKWKAIEKDKKEIDNIYDTKKSAPKDKKENPKIVKTCNLPKVFLKCVKSSKRESNFAYPQEILDEINKANGTKVDFAAIQVFENGAHNSPSTTGYIPW
ncbi:MAG: hypothetical protein K2O70_04430, partial [Desulfovibrionaceae bacterium]|nr:hypothetical protein [Desulfovibrionaceae bacterium]